MSGFGWGHGTPQAGLDVAAAFYAGRPRKRSNCETDGEHYWLLDTCIARRLDIPMSVVRAFAGQDPNPEHLPDEPEFSYHGWGTAMTARHLCALGVDAAVFDRKPCFNHTPVSAHEWFTKNKIAALVPPPPKIFMPPRTRFVNLTMELFPA